MKPSLYPRSLLRLVVLGNILMLLPSALVIGYAVVMVERVSERSEALAVEANRTGRLCWELPEDLRHMERNLRQYDVLNDQTLLDDYAMVREEWRQNAEEFATIPLMSGLAPRVGEMLAIEDAAFRKLGGDGASLRALQATVATLIEKTLPMTVEASRIIDAESAVFRAQAATLRQRLVAGMVTAFAFAGLLMFLGRRLMARLLSRIERAVLALGEGRLDRKIQLKGPDDMRRIGERLEWLRCRLRDLEEQRTRVLRHVSHELKTPLAALREGSSLLSDQVAGTLTEQQSRIVGIMQNNALRLQTLIDGLLRLQRTEYALEHIERVPLRLDEAVQQVLATHQLAARDKRLKMTGTLAPLTVAAGREELTTIVNNIVANAIKYSPDGGTVNLSLTREEHQAVLDVQDQGPGISAEDREKIFEPFYRAPGTKTAAGTGLGLAIAREFVHAHHGTLELIGAEGGAHFRIRLPLIREKLS